MICPNQECQSTNFYVNETTIDGEDYIVITCNSCNALIGVFPDPQPLLKRIKELEDKVEDIESRVSDLED